MNTAYLLPSLLAQCRVNNAPPPWSLRAQCMGGDLLWRWSSECGVLLQPSHLLYRTTNRPSSGSAERALYCGSFVNVLKMVIYQSSDLQRSAAEGQTDKDRTDCHPDWSSAAQFQQVYWFHPQDKQRNFNEYSWNDPTYRKKTAPSVFCLDVSGDSEFYLCIQEMCSEWLSWTHTMTSSSWRSCLQAPDESLVTCSDLYYSSASSCVSLPSFHPYQDVYVKVRLMQREEYLSGVKDCVHPALSIPLCQDQNLFHTLFWACSNVNNCSLLTCFWNCRNPVGHTWFLRENSLRTEPRLL